MKLTIAKSAGYCFGVKRAVNMVYQEAEEAKVPVYTYGDRKSTRLNSSHTRPSRMPSSA